MSEAGPTLPVDMGFGEIFSFFGRIFIFSGHLNSSFDTPPLGLELVNDATGWVERADLARAGANRPAFIYNDREDRWLTAGGNRRKGGQ